MALLCLGVAFAMHWYWVTGPTAGSDMAMSLFRTYVLDRSVHERLFFPRWGMDLNFTLGAPLFQYKPPLAHYGLLLFHWTGLDWVEAAKALATAVLLLGTLGLYVYARWLFSDRRAALVGAGAYLLAPYLLTNLYERGAIGEGLALAVFPWLLWALHHILKERNPVWPWAAALLVAAMTLAHNITAFFLIPAAALYIFLLLWKEHSWPRLLPVAAAIVLGLALSAFYWAPAMLEIKYAQIDAHTTEGLLQADHNLVPLNAVLQPGLLATYQPRACFRLSLWQALLGALCIVVALTARSLGRLRFNLALLAGLVLVALLLQLDVTGPIWMGVPMVRYIQFPWRLLGAASFAIALLVAALLRLPQLSGLKGWIVAAGLLAVILVCSTSRLSPEFSGPKRWLSNDEFTETGLFERGRGTFTPFSDFLPAAVTMEPRDTLIPRPAGTSRLAPLATPPALAVSEDGPNRLVLEADAAQPVPLRFHVFYFPGWQVYVDGRAVATGPSGDLGLVTAELPAGKHRVTLQFDETPLRKAADTVALAALVICIGGAFVLPSARRAGIGIGAAVVVLAVLLLAHQGLGEPPLHPVASPAVFANDVRLLGYDLPQQTWRAGDQIPIRLYWLAGQTPPADLTVFVHLITPDDAARAAQNDSLPVLGFSLPTRWEPSEVIVDDHQITLGQDTPPGDYRVVVGLYSMVGDGLQNQAVLSAPALLPGDRVALASIRVEP